LTVTATILWFGGQSVGLSTETPLIVGSGSEAVTAAVILPGQEVLREPREN
jgi:hypothetical protein